MSHNTIMAESQNQSWVINSIVWELATLVHREDNSTSTSQQLLSLNWPIELPDHQIQPDWSICEMENFNWLRVFRFTTHRTAFTSSSYFPGNFSVIQSASWILLTIPTNYLFVLTAQSPQTPAHILRCVVE